MSTDQAKAAVVVECVMVPREPTREMIDAGGRRIGRDVYHFGHAERIHEYTSPDFQAEHRRLAEVAWPAMLAASPTSPESSRLGEGELPSNYVDQIAYQLQYNAEAGYITKTALTPKQASAIAARPSASPGVAGEVSDAMVERACKAYDDAAVAVGFNSTLPHKDSVHFGWMHAALTAALGTVQRGSGGA